MTSSSHWLGATALACFAALSACGSRGSTGGGGSSTGSSAGNAACLGPSFSSNACESCIQASCGSPLGSFQNDCSDYIQCYCPNGAFNGSAQTSQACVSKVTANPSCISSVQTMNNCLNQNCASSCQSSGGSTGGSSGGGGGGSGAGSSGGTGGVTAACGVAFTTASCASCVSAKCCSVTQTCGADQACLSIITCIHQCNGAMMCEQNCVSSAPMSAQMELNAAGSCWTSSCTRSGC